MRKLLTILALSFGAFAHAEETAYRIVDRVQMDTHQTIYFTSHQGWGAKECPDAKYLFIREGEDRLAGHILSLVLSSQATGRTIKAKGSCHDNLHFRVSYLIQGEK